MYPQEFIDKIKEEVPLEKLVEEYTTLKRIGHLMYEGHCPHPNHKDSTPSFRVFKKGYKSGKRLNEFDSWSCMGCHSGKKNEKSKIFKNVGSDSISFIIWMENLKWRDAVAFLANKYHIPIPSDKNDTAYKNNRAIANSLMHNLYGEPFTYLNNRGLSIEDCDNWSIGFDGKKIVFPLLDRYKNVLGFTRRWLEVPEGRNDKYKNSYNSEIFNKSMYLYGIHNLSDEIDEIRITEGPMDVILADKYKAKNIVATLGTAFTQSHVDMIKHYKKTPVFCMDGDPAGLISIKKAIDLLAQENIYSKILLLPNGKDLADMSIELKEGIEDYINDNSITYGNFLLQDIFNKYNSKVNEIKVKLYPEVKDILKLVPTEDEKIVLKSYIKNIMDIEL